MTGSDTVGASRPPLQGGEEVLFDHVPSLRRFRTMAAVVLAITLIPTGVFAVVWSETNAAVIPLVLTCVLLMQERLTFGRHRAWITNKRVILQGGDETPLAEISEVRLKWAGLKLLGANKRLTYVENPRAVKALIEAALVVGKDPA